MECGNPIDCKRYRIRGLKGRDHYVIFIKTGKQIDTDFYLREKDLP